MIGSKFIDWVVNVMRICYIKALNMNNTHTSSQDNTEMNTTSLRGAFN